MESMLARARIASHWRDVWTAGTMKPPCDASAGLSASDLARSEITTRSRGRVRRASSGSEGRQSDNGTGSLYLLGQLEHLHPGEVRREPQGRRSENHVRIHFESLLNLARAGREVRSGVCVGSVPPELRTLWDRLRGLGVRVELYKRSHDSWEEQGVDQCLQVHMLRALADAARPQVAVLFDGRWRKATRQALATGVPIVYLCIPADF
jgi:hypothetical protein